MTIKNGDMPAMPLSGDAYIDFVDVCLRGGSYNPEFQGLTKREIMAMHMMAANRARGTDYQTWEMMAADAVDSADALLAELERTK